MAEHTPTPPAGEEASHLPQTPSSPHSPPTPASPKYTIFALNGAPTSLPDSNSGFALPVVGDKSRLDTATSNMLTYLFKSHLECINARKSAGETGLAWHDYTRSSITFKPERSTGIDMHLAVFNALKILLEFYTMSWLGGKPDGAVLGRGQYLLKTLSREALDKRGVRHHDVAHFVGRLCRKEWPEQEVEKKPTRRSERLRDRIESSD